MRLLWNENFAYKWSFKAYSNTAVLGLNKHTSDAVIELYQKIKEKITVHEMVDQLHPVKLAAIISKSVFDASPIRQLTTELFDPGWFYLYPYKSNFHLCRILIYFYVINREART
jgi:hypothetical protein